MGSSVYLKGVMWFVAVSLVSAMNDALVKLVGTRLSSIEITFFRFLMSMMILLPFMIAKGKDAFVTPHWRVHGIRALLLFMAIVPWCYGVISLPLTLVTTLSFTTPFFVLVLSRIFLKERVGRHRMLATLVGFCGILVSAQPTGEGLNWTVLVLVVSTLLFASLDVVNKKLMIKNETLLSMLFFSALGTTLFSFPLAMVDFQLPNAQELLFLCFLGGGANLILFCLLKAFSLCDLSALQPFRYTELFFAGCLGWFLFGEIPSLATLCGAALIIPATLYIVYYETIHQTRKQKALQKALDAAY